MVDIHSYRRYLQEYPELYQNQIAEAGTILVSKTEQASAEEKQQIFSALRSINPTAQIITDHYSHLPPDEWLHLLEKAVTDFSITALLPKPLHPQIQNSFLILLP